MSYRDYFDIDPEYFPQVDKRIIDTQPDLWKKFYPHPSFVAILKATVDVLKRKQKLSVWVDGAYGTGKSHAVLTLKKLIEASDEEIIEMDLTEGDVVKLQKIPIIDAMNKLYIETSNLLKNDLDEDAIKIEKNLKKLMNLVESYDVLRKIEN